MAPKFYGYENHIMESLRKYGYESTFVSHHTLRLIDSLIQFLPLKIQTNIYQKKLSKKFNKIKGNCDLFICIKGDYLTEKHIKILRENHPNIRCIMYQWDSVRNCKYLHLTPYFDKVATFDFEDSEKYNIRYLPLFYTTDIRSNDAIAKDIDYLLIGMFNKDRYEYFLKLNEICNSHNLKLYSYLYIPFGYYIKNQVLRNSLKIRSISHIKFKPLSRNKLIYYYNRANVIVDICRPHQTGLSMRVIESYGLNKKILTANDMITRDSFVKEMLVLDSSADENKIIDFINIPVSKYHNISELSIDKWTLNLLNL